MKKVIAITQARLRSTRFPRKILQPIAGVTFLELHLNRLKCATTLNGIVVATSAHQADDELAQFCEQRGFSVYRGSERDVLDRFYRCAQRESADVIVRITSDCPLVDPKLIDEMVKQFLAGGCDYLSNVHPPTFPDGFDIEVFHVHALEAAWRHFGASSDRAHVTPYLREARDTQGAPLFSTANVAAESDFSDLRLTLDAPEDVEVFEAAIMGCGTAASWRDYSLFLRAHPEVVEKNLHRKRNSAYSEERHREAERPSPKHYRFDESVAYLQRALKTVPLGSQTFSKSKLQFPTGAAPLFAKSARGSQIQDIDGNTFYDFSNSLLAITLGYADPDVNAAVREQLDAGTIFSLPHPLECEVSELLCSCIPCAEMVRFGKNGSDATSAAIRLSRAHTGRDHVIVCGYHGWQDWYIGSTARHLGVPPAVRALTHAVPYNDVDAFEKVLKEHPGQIAAIILEPTNFAAPLPGYLEALRERATAEGIVLVFDETITGFRLALGGAQEFFGVTPDLACFGKGMSNGFPLSAIVGRRDIMKGMEQIFFSTTFGGDVVALVAAKATIQKFRTEKVISRLFTTGQRILDEVTRKIEDYELGDVFRLQGYPPWTLLGITPQDGLSVEEIRTLQMQELCQFGILMASTHNVSFAHGEKELETLFAAYDHFFDLFSWARSRSTVRSLIRGEVLTPVFKVR